MNGVGVQTVKELKCTCLGCEEVIKTREGFHLWEKMVNLISEHSWGLCVSTQAAISCFALAVR